jgi:hypothetical protein
MYLHSGNSRALRRLGVNIAFGKYPGIFGAARRIINILCNIQPQLVAAQHDCLA